LLKDEQQVLRGRQHQRRGQRQQRQRKLKPEPQPTQLPVRTPFPTQDFMDEGRGDNEKRVVRTEKDKKWNIVKDLTVKIGSGLNSQDYEKVWTLLQDLLKEIEKAKILI
jgi:hypothetical protein